MIFSNNKYVVVVAVLAMRRTPDHRSEMINQLLFGEELFILEAKDKWVYVRTVWDQYEGWLENRVEYFELAKLSLNSCLISGYYARLAKNDQLLSVPTASYLGNSSFHLVEGLTSNLLSIKESLNILEQNYYGAPYLWGGKTAYGIDCSGLVQIYAKFMGKHIPRDAKDQSLIGETISFENIQIGDLLFFDGNFKQQVNHVAILSDIGNVLHSSGSVRKDRLHPEGIWNVDLKIYTHKYLFAKRI